MPAWMPHPEPLEVRHEKGARRLSIAWDDGHTSVYSLDYLRSWCPCAGCQGHAPTARYLDLVGQDLDRGAARVFRLSRVVGTPKAVGPAGAFEPPPTSTWQRSSRDSLSRSRCPTARMRRPSSSASRLR